MEHIIKQGVQRPTITFDETPAYVGKKREIGPRTGVVGRFLAPITEEPAYLRNMPNREFIM